MRKWPAQVGTVVAKVGRELSLLKMAINMADADYLLFFLWNKLEPRCQQRAAGSLELLHHQQFSQLQTHIYTSVLHFLAEITERLCLCDPGTRNHSQIREGRQIPMKYSFKSPLVHSLWSLTWIIENWWPLYACFSSVEIITCDIWLITSSGRWPFHTPNTPTPFLI